MKNLKEALAALANLKHDLGLTRNKTGEILEMIGKFIDREMDDVIEQIDYAVDRIEELETELKEAQAAAEEWEEKYNAIV